MAVDALAANAVTAQQELEWFSAVTTARGAISFTNDADQPPVATILPPDVTNDSSPYAALIRQFAMSHAETACTYPGPGAAPAT